MWIITFSDQWKIILVHLIVETAGKPERMSFSIQDRKISDAENKEIE